MPGSDWDCPVCQQPNVGDDSICISCGCSVDATPEDVSASRVILNEPHASSIHVEATPESRLPPQNIPVDKFMLLFPAEPTVNRSVAVFAVSYGLALAILLPLVLSFRPATASSAVYGALLVAAMTVGEYWNRCNMLPQLRAAKWTLALYCLGVTLVADLVAAVAHIDIHNVVLPSLIVFQKLVQLLFLRYVFGRGWSIQSRRPTDPVQESDL